MNKYLIALLIFCLMIVSSLALGELGEKLKFSPAKLISKGTVRHPDMNYNEREDGASYDSGVVELIYIVDEQGRATEISIHRSSLKKFEAVAIKSIQTHSYRPATVDGKPVSSVMKSNVVFEINRRSIAFDRWYLRTEGQKQDSEFSVLYRKLKKQSSKKQADPIVLAKLLDKMTALKSRSFNRLVNTSLAKLSVAEILNLADQRISALQELLWFTEIEYEGKKDDPESLSAIRRSLLKLLIDNGRYSDALTLYEGATTSDQAIKIDFSDYILQIETLKNSEGTLGRVLDMPISGKLGVSLLKRAFTFDNISGRLDSIKLRCETKFVSLAFKFDAEYRVPSNWGACHLELIGEPGASAQLLEF